MKSVIVELSVDIGHLNAKPNNHQVNQCPLLSKKKKKKSKSMFTAKSY
jgi:hypothetical protein